MPNSTPTHFAGYTKQQAAAIRQALIRVNPKIKDWRRRWLSEITCLLLDVLEGDLVPGRVAYPGPTKRGFKRLIAAIESAIRAYGQLGERAQWHVDDHCDRWYHRAPVAGIYLDRRCGHWHGDGAGGRVTTHDVLSGVRNAARLAAEKPSPHVTMQKGGTPKNHVMRLAVRGLLDIFEEITGIEPKVYVSQSANAGYAGNFFEFAVACLAPARLTPAKSLGSVILTEYKDRRKK